MKKKITLKLIAKELDVSISTVSKSLKNSKEISKETREKVQAFAKFYNYRPNNIALSLKNKKTKTIGVIIPEIVHYFFSKVIFGIEHIANQRGYNVIIGLSNESFSKEVLNMEMLANGSIDGFILSISKETLEKRDFHHFNETIAQGMPIVMFDRVEESIQCDKVIVDDFLGSKKAVEKLIDNNCKSIAIVTTKDYVTVGALRTNGYVSALKDKGIALKESLVLKVEDSELVDDNLTKLENHIEQMFLDEPSIDGVFAVNEIYALTVMKVARKLNKRIPEDIQVIGFSDGVLSQNAVPTLTSVSQHAQKIGERAAGLLINRLELEDNDEAENIIENYETEVIETELIERESTK
tara:strand:- start:981 stop:2039 length:1059 start_codon:yes stop_codon:yes gene_type:complete